MEAEPGPSWFKRHETLIVASIATLAVAFAIVLIVVLMTGRGSPQAQATAAVTRSAPPAPESPEATPTPSEEPWTPPAMDLSSLPVVDPWAVTPRAPADPEPWVMPDGTTVVPKSEDGAFLYDAPRGDPFAVLPVVQYQVPAAYPVIEREGRWLQVMLTSRRELPSKAGKDGVNGATGWVYEPDVKLSHNPYEIVVNIARSNVTLSKDGTMVASTEAGVGRDDSPTPVGRTFVMSVYHDPAVTYTDKLIGLGSHSPTLDSFSGGPAPIAIHAYSTHQGKISNGCVRIPASELAAFAQVPTGTPVLIVPGDATDPYPGPDDGG